MKESQSHHRGLPERGTGTNTHTRRDGGTTPTTSTVSNVGRAPTSGAVSMTDTIPTGLTATALSGTGWFCASRRRDTSFKCDWSAAVCSSAVITLAVSVAANAPASVTNTATVAGG